MPVRIVPSVILIFFLLAACTRNPAEKRAEEHDSMCWRLIDTVDAPAPRFDHAMAVDHGTKKIYLHGGRGAQTRFFDDLWFFEPGKSEWRRIDTEGGPVARSGHSMVLDPAARRLLVFGGFNINASGEVAFLQDLWIFNDEDGWNREFFTAGPVGRAWHAAMITQEAMVVFGGFGGPPHYYLQDIWSLSLSELSFRRIATDGGPLMAGSPALQSQGGASSLLAYGPSSIRVFGRDGVAAPARARLWSLQVELDHWSVVGAKNPPDDDFTFTAADEEGNRLLVVRGPTEEEIESGDLEWIIWTLDGGEDEWKAFEAVGGPATSHRLACVANPDQERGWICFGGARKREISDETWSLFPCADDGEGQE